jgi:eukaryotic-like serine/threonine-protein kinase
LPSQSAPTLPSQSAPTLPSQSAPTLPSQSAQQRAAEGLAGLLAQSAADRSSIVNAARSVSQCGPALSQAPQVFESAAEARQRLLSQLASLPGPSALSGQMLQALTSAWLASATADRDFAQWAQDELSQGCTRNDQGDPSFQAAAGPDDQATAGKKAFVSLWNPMAARYGLPSYPWNQL